MNLQGKTIIITGAGSGIGAALARRFAAQGPQVMLLLDLQAEGLEKLAAELAGHPVETGVCDAADADAIATVVSGFENRFGRVDLFCANAGVFIPGGADAGPADWRKALDINLMSHIHAVHACLPGMLSRGRGYFLHTISAAGLLSQIGSAPYTVSKHAALGFAEWVAITHGGQGIGVTALCPQGVKTAMLDSIDNPDSVASAGLASPESVADCALDAIERETFLALPHPDVAEHVRRKAADHDRWIRGMQRFQDSLQG